MVRSLCQKLKWNKLIRGGVWNRRKKIAIGGEKKRHILYEVVTFSNTEERKYPKWMWIKRSPPQKKRSPAWH